jgi:5,10-methylenetetrahydromethanopterin reductase
MIPGILNVGHHPASHAVEVAQLGESVGFEQFWVADERFYRDAYALLAAVALGTKRITMGTCVTDPYTRHPALTTVSVATLDEMSDGRALFGLGTGISGFLELGLERPKPVAAMREAIELFRRLLTGELVDYAGKVISFQGGRLNFKPPRTDIPVYVATNGPQGQRMSGRIADGVIMEACAQPEEAAAFVKMVRGAAKEAGRDPASVRCIARLNACVAPDGKVARDAVRLRAARTLSAGLTVLSTHEALGLRLRPEVLAEVAGIPYAAGGAPYARILPHVTDRHVDAVALAGTVDEVTAHVAALKAVGIDGITISPYAPEGETTAATIRALGPVIAAA